MPRMIFFSTLPNEHGSAAGSGIRRRAMLAAFRGLGYEVEEVTGAMAARLPRLRRALEKIERGTQFDFLYMENATIPLHMTEPRLALVWRHPFADVQFLRACRRHRIPVGINNNDVWWRFPSYRQGVPLHRRLIRRPFYHLEYWLYGQLADVFYVPHIAMANWIPGRFRRVEMLPHGVEPGTEIPASAPAMGKRGQLNLFYVGGIGAFYRLYSLLDALRRVDHCRLVLCCRPAEWQEWRARYAPFLSDRVEIVHAQGEQLQPYLEAADVLSCFVAPDPYWRATLPIKVFEYLRQGKPILAAQDTNAGQFVVDHDLGWAVADDPEQIAALLGRLIEQPEELAAKAKKVRRVLPQHTWQARARKVAADLRGLHADTAVPLAQAASIGQG